MGINPLSFLRVGYFKSLPGNSGANWGIIGPNGHKGQMGRCCLEKGEQIVEQKSAVGSERAKNNGLLQETGQP